MSSVISVLFTNDATFALRSFLAFLVDKNKVMKAVGWRRKKGPKSTRYSSIRERPKNIDKKRLFNQQLFLKYLLTLVTIILLIGCVQAHTSTASCSWWPRAWWPPSWYWITTTAWPTLTRCQAGWVDKLDKISSLLPALLYAWCGFM